MTDRLIRAGGRPIPGAVDRIRRYCGLTWSGGADETWAWRYYDLVPTPADDDVTTLDVLCAAALHPGLSREDLDFYWSEARHISAWLQELPPDVSLGEADEGMVKHLVSLPDVWPERSVALLSKVLHRKRPHLLPLIDRHVIDWYRPVTGQRAAARAWEPLVRSMRRDLQDEGLRDVLASVNAGLAEEIWPDQPPKDPPALSWLRMIDIAIWMGSR